MRLFDSMGKEKMTLRIGIGLSFYNDFDSLQRMLHSLQSYPINDIIAVDGRYKGHAGRNPLSDKVVTDLFKTIQTPNCIHLLPDVSQIEKRQLYFEHSKDRELDVIIVMDSDEFIVHHKTNWSLFIEELEHHINENKDTFIQAYTIPLIINQKRYTPDYTINSARVFYKPWQLQYVENHHTIRNKRTGINMGYQTHTTKLEHLTIETDHKLRTKDYMLEHDLYEQYQQTDEETQENSKKRLDAFIRIRDSYPQH